MWSETGRRRPLFSAGHGDTRLEKANKRRQALLFAATSPVPCAPRAPGLFSLTPLLVGAHLTPIASSPETQADRLA